MIHPAAVVRAVEAMAREIESVSVWAQQQQTCLRKAVGASAVWVNDDGSLFRITQVHNGPSAKGHKCTNEVGNCGCSHSEPRCVRNLLAQGWNSDKFGRKVILMCTYSPCTNCANIINDSGIIHAVVYKILTEHDKRGAILLEMNGIPALPLEELKAGRHHDIVGKWR